MPDAISEPLRRLQKEQKNVLLQRVLENLQCPICQETMTVPFVLAGCGHSFCYSCIKSWLANSLSCPMCRQDVGVRPVLDVRLRKVFDDIAEAIVAGDPGRKGAIDKYKQDKGSDYERDRAAASAGSGQLFDSLFAQISEAVIDVSDGVPRCSVCHWEVHGGVCDNCGRRLMHVPSRGLSRRIEEGVDDLDEDSLDAADALGLGRAIMGELIVRHAQAVAERGGDRSWGGEEDEEGDSEYTGVSGEDEEEDEEDREFVDHRPLDVILADEESESETQTESDDDEVVMMAGHRDQDLIFVDDEDAETSAKSDDSGMESYEEPEEEPVRPVRPRRRLRRSRDESEDEDVMVLGGHRRPMVIEDSDEE